MLRRVFVIVIILLLALVPVAAQAQKRRAVGVPSTPPPVSNDCHTFGLVRPGLVASYQSNPPTNFTITWLQDTLTKTVTKQKVTTPQSTADADTILDGEVVGTLRGIRHINVKVATPVPVLGTMTIETDIDFVPSLIAGPTDGWCVGKTWNVPPVTETVTVKSPIAPPTNRIVTTAASQGQVLAVGETVVVPAGSFKTVKYKGVLVSDGNVQTAITWVSMDLNIVVRQETLDASGAVTSTVELTSVQ